MKLEENMAVVKIVLMPFLFIISFIKHFFIGIKFIFFDVWKSIFSYQKAKSDFRKRGKNNMIKIESSKDALKK